MKVILFRGMPGVGKTTITNAFAQKVNFPVIRKDDLYDTTAKFVADHKTRNDISYGELYKLLESNKDTSCVLILDFPFYRQDDFTIIKNFCVTNHIKLESILVICSDESLWKKRFNERKNNPAPNQLITNFTELKKYIKTTKIEPEQNEIVVDTINTIDDIINTIGTLVK